MYVDRNMYNYIYNKLYIQYSVYTSKYIYLYKKYVHVY